MAGNLTPTARMSLLARGSAHRSDSHALIGHTPPHTHSGLPYTRCRRVRWAPCGAWACYPCESHEQTLVLYCSVSHMTGMYGLLTHRSDESRGGGGGGKFNSNGADELACATQCPRIGLACIDRRTRTASYVGAVRSMGILPEQTLVLLGLAHFWDARIANSQIGRD